MAKNGLFCHHCKASLKGPEPEYCTWLELSWKTNKFHAVDGEIPKEESQGWFVFGKRCAKTIIKNGGCMNV